MRERPFDASSADLDRCIARRRRGTSANQERLNDAYDRFHSLIVTAKPIVRGDAGVPIPA